MLRHVQVGMSGSHLPLPPEVPAESSGLPPCPPALQDLLLRCWHQASAGFEGARTRAKGILE